MMRIKNFMKIFGKSKSAHMLKRTIRKIVFEI